MVFDHGRPWSTMVLEHGRPWLDMVLIRPWSTMGGHLTRHGRPWSTMVDHGYMTMDYHGRPWYSMVTRPSFSPANRMPCSFHLISEKNQVHGGKIWTGGWMLYNFKNKQVGKHPTAFLGRTRTL